MSPWISPELLFGGSGNPPTRTLVGTAGRGGFVFPIYIVVSGGEKLTDEMCDGFNRSLFGVCDVSALSEMMDTLHLSVVQLAEVVSVLVPLQPLNDVQQVPRLLPHMVPCDANDFLEMRDLIEVDLRRNLDNNVAVLRPVILFVASSVALSDGWQVGHSELTDLENRFRPAILTVSAAYECVPSALEIATVLDPPIAGKLSFCMDDGWDVSSVFWKIVHLVFERETVDKQENYFHA